MTKAIKIILGVILTLLPVVLTFPGMALESWGYAALDLIKGGITLMVLFVGIILTILGISELKD